ncbi:phosphatidate cytidylyltransferase [Phycicoccus endophyticus]|uniref:Phosphatidate cytidylyltransferase n=1 Tax=Phycicoccus endophyticus TaxID=1690220 RepID=A0A7G9QY67_9MICO|nr:phosphatidate cytidylyltransferase [Phycicoccus endophyticus]NHI19178.1 phosphatidate cytidylyltransferase [Phycicoccus endophyticus]QNN48292.1 phosphatidate cytidylyltransferase [Phycicoccus endophyticus]GGL40768.1 phosphatidate cytidylyltransferase [Phycicoccus endophyticus]
MPDRPEERVTPAEDTGPGTGTLATADGSGPPGPADAQPPTAQDPAGRTPRAGRDLRAAIVVGLLLGAVVVGTLVLDARAFLAVVTAAVTLGAWEVRRAVATRGMHVPLVPLVLGSVGMTVSAYLRGAEALVVTFGLTVVALLVWRVADGLSDAARDLSASVLVAFYPVFLGGFASLMLASPDGRLRIITFVLVTVFSDIGGYAVGVLLGRHPMAPSLSPKKSWEGLAGSVLTCAAIGAAALPLLLGGTWWAGAVLGAVTAGAATLGDLIESSVKRDLGIKDMGTLLPGHGGIMDRLDSLVVVAPIAWALLLAFVPTG